MLVIFDCDGVLIDSEAIFCSVDAEALTRLGHETSAAEISERFAGIPHRIAWQQLAAELELLLPEDWVDTILVECERRFETELEAIPGVVEALQAVRAQGHDICVASSTELVRLTTNLERAGVLWPCSAECVFGQPGQALKAGAGRVPVCCVADGL